jgi:hypothetical protein
VTFSANTSPAIAGIVLTMLAVSCGTSGGTASPSPRTTAATAPSASAVADLCPDARTCPEYLVLGVGWKPGPGGQVDIGYWINPTPPPSSPLTPTQVIDAIRAAASAWNGADPRVHLVFKGVTSKAPGPPGDENPFTVHDDVVGFAPLPIRGYTDIGHGPGGFYHGYYTSFDIRLSDSLSWTWLPCNPLHGNPCSQYLSVSGHQAGPDLQDVATHEFGHVVGLEDLTDASGDEQTEWAFTGPTPLCTRLEGCRARDTLALGDILGTRHLYPTRAPLPRIEFP